MKQTRAKIIDGAAAAKELLQGLVQKRIQFEADFKRPPQLVTVLVGENPASALYVRTKLMRAEELGFKARRIQLDHSASEAALLDKIKQLNEDDTVDGILVQMPVPKHMDSRKIIASIDPLKDVDGFHPINVGRLATGSEGLVPCTPKGCMRLLQREGIKLDGLHAVIIGRSNIVGKPLAQLLLNANCTVTQVHSKSRDIPALCRQADLLAVGVGIPELVRGDWVKPGAIVLDIGINRLILPSGDKKLVGDVCFDEVALIAAAISPVPKGVGPMTVACLMENTLEAANLRCKISA